MRRWMTPIWYGMLAVFLPCRGFADGSAAPLVTLPPPPLASQILQYGGEVPIGRYFDVKTRTESPYIQEHCDERMEPVNPMRGGRFRNPAGISTLQKPGFFRGTH